MTMLLMPGAALLFPAPAGGQEPALDVRGVDTSDFPVVGVTVTVPPEQAPPGGAPPPFRIFEGRDDRPVEVRPAFAALAVAIVVDNRGPQDPAQIRALRNAAADLALRLADAQVSVLGTATTPPAATETSSHPVSAIAALEPGGKGDPGQSVQWAVGVVSADPAAYPVVVWLGTRAEDVGQAVEAVRRTGTSLFALTLGELEEPPFPEEVRATGGLSLEGSAAELRAAAGAFAGDLARTYRLTFTVHGNAGAVRIVLDGSAERGAVAEVRLPHEALAPPRPAADASGWPVVVATVLVVVDALAVAMLRIRHRAPALGLGGVSPG